MKRGSLILLVLFVGCSPNFQSGKTQCSDKGECPSGFICSDNGAGAPRVCVNAPTSGTGGSGGGGTSGHGGSSGGGTSGFGGIGGIGGTGGTGGASASTGSSGATSACSLSDLPKAGGSCNVLPACGCPAGSVCYAATESVGLTCTADSKLGNGADCSGALACASGFGCFSDICSKYCEFDSDCPMVDMTQGCLQISWASGNDITGVSVCAEICDPVSPQNPKSPLRACPAGFGCSSDTLGDSYCQKQAGFGVTNSSCSHDSDCRPGYFCDTSGLSCVKYCYTINDCPTGTTCNFFSTANYAGNTEVGYCY